MAKKHIVQFGAVGSSFTFIIYAPMGVAAFLFIWRYVPKTRQRSLASFERYWRGGGHWEHEEAIR